MASAGFYMPASLAIAEREVACAGFEVTPDHVPNTFDQEE
jgi:hypothetical protein